MPQTKPLSQADAAGHRTRHSDSSFYDEVCELCGVTDAQMAKLNAPCPKARADTPEEVVAYLRQSAEYKGEKDSMARMLLKGADEIERLLALLAPGVVPEAPPTAAPTLLEMSEGWGKAHEIERQRSLDALDAREHAVELPVVVKARQTYEAEQARTHLFFMADWNKLARFKKREYIQRARQE